LGKIIEHIIARILSLQLDKIYNCKRNSSKGRKKEKEEENVGEGEGREEE
jgi:hypothetical protein